MQRVRKKDAQPCTDKADYFLLPYPTDLEFRIVESLPMRPIFALKWVPQRDTTGQYLIVRNSVRLSHFGSDGYAYFSCTMDATDPLAGISSMLSREFIGDENFADKVSLEVTEAVRDSLVSMQGEIP